jgi:hypothetical protein
VTGVAFDAKKRGPARRSGLDLRSELPSVHRVDSVVVGGRHQQEGWVSNTALHVVEGRVREERAEVVLFGRVPVLRRPVRTVAEHAPRGSSEVLYDEEVVIDPATERFWGTGVLVALSDKSWRYVEYLARAGKAVTTKEVGLYVSRSEYPDVSARKARVALERQVRQALEAAGADVGVVDRLIVTEGRLGVRFGVSVRVLGRKSSTHRTEVLSA